ncbi:hypothetical protein BC826DRAFT_970259 [Russula brevipes]|nr:hypothetical protein BC826DRAFT_970259 [Russula brevipes]
MGTHNFTLKPRDNASKIAKVFEASGSHVSAMTSSVTPSLLPDIPEPSTVLISGPSQELDIQGHSVHRGETGTWGRRRVTIDILPDDVLLEIFEIDTTPTRKMLDIWPALPIVIYGDTTSREGADNIVAALEHRDRVCRIILVTTLNFDRFAAAMNEPFPELTTLILDGLVLPDSFLGGFAPRLRTLYSNGISYPALPKLLSSASNLVTLDLFDIPHSGYISPEAMVTGLSALTRLERLSIEFPSPRPRPDQPSPPPSIRTVLPALNYLSFRGVSEYLEDLTSRIDAPLLCNLSITFFNQPIFNTPRHSSFISRAERLRPQSQAQLTLSAGLVNLSYKTAGGPGFNLTILCTTSDGLLSSLTHSPFLSFFNLEHLEIREGPRAPRWEDVENIQWLELLRLFTTVKRLSLCKKSTPRIMHVLQELPGEGMMDVFPALQSISLPETSLSGPVKEAFARFLTARQLFGHPVAVNPQGDE